MLIHLRVRGNGKYLSRKEWVLPNAKVQLRASPIKASEASGGGC